MWKVSCGGKIDLRLSFVTNRKFGGRAYHAKVEFVKTDFLINVGSFVFVQYDCVCLSYGYRMNMALLLM